MRMKMKDLKEMQQRLDMEAAAEVILKAKYKDYRRKGGWDNYPRWKNSLLVHFVIKSMEAENFKGSGI